MLAITIPSGEPHFFADALVLDGRALHLLDGDCHRSQRRPLGRSCKGWPGGWHRRGWHFFDPRFEGREVMEVEIRAADGDVVEMRSGSRLLDESEGFFLDGRFDPARLARQWGYTPTDAPFLARSGWTTAEGLLRSPVILATTAFFTALPPPA